MLTGLTIGNFKAFGEPQHIPIRPLTLIFGANSSGKSSIIHSLLLADHALETGHWDAHQPRRASGAVDLGGFSNFVHQQQVNGTILLRIEASPNLDFIKDSLYGKEAETEPFLALRGFGLTLEVARRRAAKDAESDPTPALVQGICVDLDGHPAFRFDRKGESTFRCTTVAANNPFLQRVLAAMLRLSDAYDRAKHGQESHPDALADRPAQGPTGAPAQSGDQRGPAIAAAFSEVLMERTFEFSRAEIPFQDLRALVEVDEGCRLVPGTSYVEEQVQNRAGVIDLCESTYRDDDLLKLDLHEGRFLPEPDPAELESRKPRQRLMQNLEPAAQAARLNLSVLLKCVTLQANALLRRLRYVGPLRRVPARHPGAEWPTLPGGQPGEHAAWREVCRDDRVRDRVNRWLGDGCLNTPYRLGVRRLNDPENPLAEPLMEPIFRCGASTLLSHHDLGFGVSQVLPVLVTAAAPSRTVIAIEQPELHLHPALQAELGDVFIESALGEPKNTFLLETHSEHLILRIMRRIRESTAGKADYPSGLPKVTPADVAVLFVEPTPSGSVVREMRLDQRGRLVDAWPGGFFEEAFNELF